VKNGTFRKRLQRCIDRGNLTTADLCRWFDRPYATCRSWLTQGWEPAGGPVTQQRMWRRLEKLETAVRANGRELRDLPMGKRAERLTQLGQ